MVKVLIVDDSQTVRQMVSELLTKQGMKQGADAPSDQTFPASRIATDDQSTTILC